MNDSRLDEVGIWLKMRLYGAQHIPHVHDAHIYYERWLSWWTACQPPWRKAGGWPFSRENTNTSWGKLEARGQNGIFIVVMSTTWWASSIKSAEDVRAFDEAVDDVHWVLGQFLKRRSSLGAPKSPPPPTGLQKPVSTASWLVRPPGKHQPKPSYKARR